MKRVLCIVGPTATGKTGNGIRLAKRYDGEIISGDSIQIYKELNIGSAKVTEDEMCGIPHYLIDEFDLTDSYNVNFFQEKARYYIDEITKIKKLPIIVGGTGLYIKAATYDYDFPVMEKQETQEEFTDLSNEQILRELEKLDKKSAEAIHPNNRKRLVRALQMAKNGYIKSEVVQKQEHKPIYDVLFVGLTLPREHLYERINKRVDMMIDAGLEKEITELRRKYEDLFTFRGMQGIGYKEWEPYFDGICSKEEVIDAIKLHSRQFARRQYTWFNNQMDVKWFDVDIPDYFERLTEVVDQWMKDGIERKY